MAINTVARRAAAALVALPFGRVATIPAGIVAAAQRIAAGFYYNGLSGDPTPAPPVPNVWVEIVPGSNAWVAIPET